MIKNKSDRKFRYSLENIKSIGLKILFHNENEIQFIFKGEKINFFPYSGWATGKTITDCRGIENLLNQLKTK